jgi:hypothetical protein
MADVQGSGLRAGVYFRLLAMSSRIDVIAVGTATGSCTGAAPQHGAGVYLRLSVLAAAHRFAGRDAQCGCVGHREMHRAPQACTGLHGGPTWLHRDAPGPTGMHRVAQGSMLGSYLQGCTAMHRDALT